MPVAIRIIALLAFVTVINGYVLNSDPQYQRWVNGKVPFYVNPGDYSEEPNWQPKNFKNFPKISKNFKIFKISKISRFFVL